MIKKIIFTFLICFLIASCGKKGDPKYKEPEQKSENTIILNNKA